MSFHVGGSTALYVLAYATYYFFQRTRYVVGRASQASRGQDAPLRALVWSARVLTRPLSVRGP